MLGAEQMASFIFNNMTIDEAHKSIDEALKTFEMPKIASLNWQDNDMTITIEKMGVSKVSYRLKQDGKDTLMSEISRQISPFHRPFVTTVQSIIEQVLVKSGATLY